MAAQETDANEESELEKLDKELTKLHGNNYKGFTQDKVIFDTVEKVPLVSVSLNKMLEGGLALGRIIELFGPSGSGKSSVALHTVYSYQKHGLRCAWIDAESAYTDTYARMCGVDTRKLAQMRPETANDALETIRSLAKSGLVSLIVLDSVAALVPKDEFDKDVGGGMIGSLARLMSSSLKQLAHYASDNNCTLLFINQERAANIGGYGPKSVTSGGSALTYYCSIRIDLNRTAYIEVAGEKKGLEVRAQTVKNKCGTPFKEASFSVLYPDFNEPTAPAGLDIIADILQSCIDLSIISKQGSWLVYNDLKIQGIEKFKTNMRQDEVLVQKLRSALTSSPTALPTS